MSDAVTNVIFAGLGGQGVLTASDILAEAAFSAGWDVKKADVHGMSQRGGSVRSDVRFGREVFSPMVPAAAADFLVVLSADQTEHHRAALRPGGILIEPQAIDAAQLSQRRDLNIALLGVLSRHLTLDPQQWEAAIRKTLKPRFCDGGLHAFALGRDSNHVIPPCQ
jgi:indolepyruvate ferredoxin oxidoreductase, beta subunit